MTEEKKHSFTPLKEIEEALAKDGMTLEDLIDQMAESQKQRPLESYKPGTNPLTDEDWDAEPNEDDTSHDLNGNEPV